MSEGWLLVAVSLGLLIAVLAARRITTMVVTLRARALAPAFHRRLARWVRPRSYSEDDFFRADGVSGPWMERRRRGLDRLSEMLRAQYPQSRAWGAAVREGFSDLRFTDANRVPFPFQRVMRERFELCSVVSESDGPYLHDLDGHWTLDVSGSYGVNVAGFGRYKEWMARGLERVQDLGPVLGPLHPVVAENITRLRRVSGLDEVSFHMSGTEAVMAAVRLARFNTGRKLIVCFAGAYHGWWDGVQPGLGSERPLDDCLVLKDLNPVSLDVIRRRAGEIAAVLVNPVQSFHPNTPPPSDAILLTSDTRRTEAEPSRYAQWLRQLRAACTESGLPLVFDEVYTGFRLAPGGAQEHFGVSADMVVYGKTVAGGFPIGVVCGRKGLMRRFDPERPLRIAYVIGTFSAHPVVMGAMNEFLRWVTEASTAQQYGEMNERCAQWVRATNQRLAEAVLPLRVVHLGTVWTVLFTEPGRYNWLLQYYLRAQGVTLSWVGTGRCLSSMDFTDKDYEALQTKLLDAAHTMKGDGWWLTAAEHPGREKRMRAGLMREVIGSLVRVPRPLQSFYTEVMRRKRDDHHASHSDVTNQLFHIISSSVFLGCYGLAFWDLTTAMWAGLAALFLRQIGHAILEPPCHDKEALLLGYNTRSKTLILGTYLLIPVVHLVNAASWSGEALGPLMATVAQQWFAWTLIVVGGRVLYLVWKHNVRLALVWFVKLATDPLTDVAAYSPRYLRRLTS
ncbi:MAG TPA: aminotransferase class III-fold pyridoxal phosphate-dependent enzyme [Methylomirabilota bacterium]|jgi:glutamate-1-semialdehyde 2,1-aminomutase